jgi:dTDP-4-amino-4,6-dideoxygalactose transaminase
MIPLLDLKRQHDTIRDEIAEAMAPIIENQSFILGDTVETLENALAGYCGAFYGVGVSSGTDALILSLMAQGVGPGDEVITTPFTFFATAGAISRVGATPVFVDIDPRTYNMDHNCLYSAVTERTKAIIPVHLFGQCCDMDETVGFFGTAVIEDACQSIGAEWDGQRAGSIGDYGCFSFFPSKNLGAFGDGGFVTTNCQEKYERLKELRVHGCKSRYYHDSVGGNFRLDALQAAVVLAKLRHLDDWTGWRQINASCYHEAFEDAEKAGYLVRPAIHPQVTRHVWNQYTLRIKRGIRDRVLGHLSGKGIGSAVYYPLCLHEQKCFKHLGYKRGNFPHAEQAADEVLSIPIYPELTADEQSEVINEIYVAVRKFG